MILHISGMRRNVNRNVFNARKNVSATALLFVLLTTVILVTGSVIEVDTIKPDATTQASGRAGNIRGSPARAPTLCAIHDNLLGG